MKTEPSGNKSDSSDSSRDDIVPLKNDVKMNRLLFSPLKNGGKSHILDIEHYSPLQHAPTDVQLATVDNGEMLLFVVFIVCEKKAYVNSHINAFISLVQTCTRCNDSSKYNFLKFNSKIATVVLVLLLRSPYELPSTAR